MTPFLPILIPLTFLGAVMMLFEVDQRAVGLPIGISFGTVFFSFSFALPKGSVEVRILVPALAVAGTYVFVSKFYAQRKGRDAGKA